MKTQDPENDAPRRDAVAGDSWTLQPPLKKSLRLKIPVMVISLVALVLTLSFLFIMRVYEKQLLDMTHMSVTTITSMVKWGIHRVATEQLVEDIQPMLQEMGNRQDITGIRIIRTTTGEIRFASDRSEIGKSIPAERLQRIRENGWTLFDLAEDPPGIRTRANKVIPLVKERQCMECHRNAPDILGLLEVSVSLDRVNDVLDSNKTLIAVIWGGTLFMVGASLIYFLRTQIVDRVALLQTSIRTTDASERYPRLPVTEEDEIGRLAESLNDLLERLEKARDAIREAHQKEVQHLDRLATVGELAAGVAHEIKNPLAGISGIIQNIARSDTSPQRKEIYDEIQRQIVRIDRVMRNLLQFARPDTPQFDRVDVHECIESAMLLLSSQKAGADIRLERRFFPGAPLIKADRRLLQQIMVNIILNAIQARQKGSPITITVSTDVIRRMPDPRLASAASFNRRRNEETLHIAVGDNGNGIPADILPQIFKPFFTTKPEGTGLGLAICRRIIQDHGGRIDVETEPDHGTTFHIYLPIE